MPCTLHTHTRLQHSSRRVEDALPRLHVLRQDETLCGRLVPGVQRFGVRKRGSGAQVVRDARRVAPAADHFIRDRVCAHAAAKRTWSLEQSHSAPIVPLELGVLDTLRGKTLARENSSRGHRTRYSLSYLDTPQSLQQPPG